MPKGLRTLRFLFNDTNLTHFGGMVLLQRFCNKLRLRWLIQNFVKVPQRNADYLPSDLILALLYAIMAGLRRINKTEILQYNGVFLSLLGIPKFPDQSTFRRFLKRLPPTAIRQLVTLHDQLRARLFGLPKPRFSLVFDLDSVILTVYGKMQWARVGYNPKKHGRRSYHPLLCFEAHLQEFWHGSLRPGDAASSTGAVPFLKVCLAKAPKHIARSRIRIRADSGFFGKRVIEFLDSTGCGYVIVAKEYSTIKARSRECRFKKLRGEWEVAEFRYKPHKWHKPHRFVVVRRPIPQDPVEAQQLTLFKDRKYAYHVLVTNLKTHPWRVWRFYAKRATIEKNIRELLYDYPFGLQPGPLVQETLSAQRIPLYDAGCHSDRFLGAASEVDQRRKSKCTDLASRLSLPDAIRNRSKKNRQTQSSTKFMNLQMHHSAQSSIYRVFRIQNTIFTHY
jgi:hypothetical protein